MAFKLTKAEDARKAEIEGNLNKVVGDIEDAKSELESKIEELVTEFNDKHIGPFNDALSEARGFVEDIVNERQSEYDDKSERWQDGERGQAAQEWLQQWESATNELDDISEIEVPSFEFEVPDAENILCDLPTEMEA